MVYHIIVMSVKETRKDPVEGQKTKRTLLKINNLPQEIDLIIRELKICLCMN